MSSPAIPISASPCVTSDSTVDVDLEEMDIHGKLVVLNAIDLSCLSLASRCAMILLSGPWVSDDRGRFMSHPGALPELSALSQRESASAVRALIDKELIRTWRLNASLYWEVAGAYAFKKGLKAAIRERNKIARMKKRQVLERKEHREEKIQGESYWKDDDGGGTATDGNLIEMMRTSRGGHVPIRPTMFYRSSVPVPKGRRKDAMIIAQPDNEQSCLLHMYPSFNVYAGLSPLGVVLRHQLLWDSDDYGRVRIDISKLHAELGQTITKRVSMKDIKVEIHRMAESGHLLVFSRASGTFAYIRDAAQHMKGKKFRNMKIPRLVDDRDFTHDSDEYKAFFATRREHSVSREKVEVFSYNKHGDTYVIYEYVNLPAKRFLKEYEQVIRSEPYANATAETILGIDGSNTMERLELAERFWYGYVNKIPHHLMASLFDMYEDVLTDKKEARFKILRYLMGMTPQEYMDKLSKETTADQITSCP